MKINLCCSDNLIDGYVNVDRVPPADQIIDLDPKYPLVPRDGIERYWPWDDSTVSEIRAWDALEHLSDKIQTMNECWRVLQPGGILDLFVPTTDGRGAFQDPTHKTFWTPNDLFYFCEEYAEWQRFHEAYGIRARFRVISQFHELYPNHVWKLGAILECVK